MLTILYISLLLASISSAARDSYLVKSPNNSTLPNSSSRITPRAIISNSNGTTTPTIIEDIQTIYERRLSVIVGALNVSQVPEISDWLSILDPSGKWPDINYTAGCAAQRANWPAGDHWVRLQIMMTELMAAAYHGGLHGADQYIKNQAVRNSISLGMEYWFNRDFKNSACLFHGGSPSCPCSDTDNTLWNANWFSNVILIPNLVGRTCLLLNETLSLSQVNYCSKMTSRSYNSFLDSSLGGYLSGANALDVAKIGIDGALLFFNVTQIEDAFNRIHSEVAIRDAVKADGIRPDGSFGQHTGILYNGNYGKDFANDVLDFELVASGTRYEADLASHVAFETLFDGNRWMIYRNSLTGVNHWDLSVLGRFISFAVADDMATSNIHTNLSEVNTLGELWSSNILTEFARQLSKDTTNANAGSFQGNRMFFSNDYMVHRGENYVSTLKMYSSRTQNSECINTQNPLGFHLSDGALRTYLVGNEYEDIAASWDWNLIPGITVDYDASKLQCSKTRFSAIESFVGGVSDGNVGLAVMRFTNPLTKSLHWQKAWFFLPDDVQHVMISGITSATNASVRTVLDQRLYAGSIVMGDAANDLISAFNVTSTGTYKLWHGGVGYFIDDKEDSVTLSLEVGPKTGSWQEIGTSTQPPKTVDLFAAWLEHSKLKPISYTAYPGTTSDQFLLKVDRNRPMSLQNDDIVSAASDSCNGIIMAVFWRTSGGSVTFTHPESGGLITMVANASVAVIYYTDTDDVTVADPSQTLTSVEITFTMSSEGTPPLTWQDERKRAVVFTLPTEGEAGSSVTRKL